VLTALDTATGAPIWSHRFEAPLTGTPLVAGDRVIVVATNGLAAALDVATGRIDWTVTGLPAAALVMGGPRPAISGNTVLLPFPSGELQAVERAGARRLWTTHVAGTRLARAYSSIPGISADPMVAGGRVYAGNATGRFSAFELATGRVAWSAPDGAMDAAWMAGGSIFLISDANTLVRLDARSGDRIWSVELPNYTRDRESRRAEVFAHYGPLLAGGRLLVVSNDGQMRSFDPVSGALLSEMALPGRAAARPAIAGGTLYVATTDGRLHALR
jgi:outer membrane protein assembly factor BamB